MTGDIVDQRYEIERLVGIGTFGKVFCAVDTKYNQLVALKGTASTNGLFGF
jgi:serine/threonine protein kinase